MKHVIVVILAASTTACGGVSPTSSPVEAIEAGPAPIRDAASLNDGSTDGPSDSSVDNEAAAPPGSKLFQLCTETTQCVPLNLQPPYVTPPISPTYGWGGAQCLPSGCSFYCSAGADLMCGMISCKRTCEDLGGQCLHLDAGYDFSYCAPL